MRCIFLKETNDISFEQDPTHFNNMTQVYLYMYDISNGMAKMLSPMILGRQMEAIWHTSIVVNDVEYLFAGDSGIISSTPETTPFGTPQERRFMGVTDKSRSEFEAWNVIQEREKFGNGDYNIINRNCNHYTEDALRFLCNVAQPDTVGKMTETVMSTPLGQIITQFVEGITQQLNAQYSNPSRGTSRNQSNSTPTPPTASPPTEERKTHWCHMCDAAVNTQIVNNEVECVVCKNNFVEERDSGNQPTEEQGDDDIPEISSTTSPRVQTSAIESIITALSQAGVENIAQAVVSGISRMLSETTNQGSQAASSSVIDNIPLIRIDIAPEDPCPICQEDFPIGTQVASLPCSHIFHADCIKNWLRLRNTCPTCRHELN